MSQITKWKKFSHTLLKHNFKNNLLDKNVLTNELTTTKANKILHFHSKSSHGQKRWKKTSAFTLFYQLENF